MNLGNKLKEKIKRHKILLQNFSFLSALQILNMSMPLIVYPYLIHVLGKGNYGLVIFAQAIVQYFVLFVSFGFNISATKAVSIYRNDKNKLGEIVSSVLIIKCLLFFFAFLVLGMFLMLIPSLHNHSALFLLSMWACLYDIIFPIWYFQGIEKMKYITYITFVSRSIFLGLIFFFVRSSTDLLLVPIINGAGALFAGSIAMIIILGKHRIVIKWPYFEKLKHYFTESVPIFVSNLSNSLYISSNKVIIGTFLGMTEVAYYDLGEKIVGVLKSPQSIITQTLFPKISAEKDASFVKKSFRYSLILNLSILIILLAFSKNIVIAMGGIDMMRTIGILNILALNVPIDAVSNVLGIQFLIAWGYMKSYGKIMFLSFLVYIVQIVFILTMFKFTIYNLACITVITQIFAAIYFYSACKKFKLL